MRHDNVCPLTCTQDLDHSSDHQFVSILLLMDHVKLNVANLDNDKKNVQQVKIIAKVDI